MARKTKAATRAADVVDLPGGPAAKRIGAFRRVRRITMPMVKLMPGVARYIRFEGLIFTGTTRRQKEGDIKNPPQLADVTVYDEQGDSDGEIYRMVVNKVLELELGEGYPDGSYVGKTFYIMRLPPAGPEKERYARFQIEEVEA